MAVRPVDAEKYMELLKEQYLHHEAMGNKQVAKAWQGAMQLLYDMPTLTPPNELLTCGLVDRHGAPLRALDTVAADKFFVYAVRYGSHNVNPDNCAPAFQVGWYLEIVWAYPGFEDSVGRTEPLYDIDGVAARYPAHCADTTDGIDNLKFEKVTRRPPEGEEDNND